jgi:hypothetical protein
MIGKYQTDSGHACFSQGLIPAIHLKFLVYIPYMRPHSIKTDEK